jgi:hypothetical protein
MNNGLCNGKIFFQNIEREDYLILNDKKELEIWDKKFQEWINNEYYLNNFIDYALKVDDSKIFVCIGKLENNSLVEDDLTSLNNLKTFWYNEHSTDNFKYLESTFSCSQKIGINSFEFNIVFVVYKGEIFKSSFVVSPDESLVIQGTEQYIYTPILDNV